MNILVSVNSDERLMRICGGAEGAQPGAGGGVRGRGPAPEEKAGELVLSPQFLVDFDETVVPVAGAIGIRENS